MASGAGLGTARSGLLGEFLGPRMAACSAACAASRRPRAGADVWSAGCRDMSGPRQADSRPRRLRSRVWTSVPRAAAASTRLGGRTATSNRRSRSAPQKLLSANDSGSGNWAGAWGFGPRCWSACSVEEVPFPADCTDGFAGAFWKLLASDQRRPCLRACSSAPPTTSRASGVNLSNTTQPRNRRTCFR